MHSRSRGWRGALHFACNGLCTAARFHTAEDNPGCRFGCIEGQDCVRHYNTALSCLGISARSGLALMKVSRAQPFSMIHFSKLLFAARDSASSSQDYWTRSRLSTYEGHTVVLASASGTSVWQNQNDDGPMPGAGSYVPTSAGATIQTSSDLKTSSYRSPNFFSMLRTCRVTTKMTGIELPC